MVGMLISADSLSTAANAALVFDGFSTGIVLGLIWYVACRMLRRTQDLRRNAAIEVLDGLALRDPALGLEALLQARQLAALGAPSERLFAGGIVALVGAILIALGARMLGLAPATEAEHEVIQLVRASELAQLPAVRAALSAADRGLYVTNGDAERIAIAGLLDR
jgi:hypothetical protein